MTAPSVTLTSYILAPWDGTYETGDKIALSYADLSFVPSASDSFKSTSGDIFKVYVDGVRIYRRSDQDYASGYGFLEDGDNSSGVKLNGLTGTVNGNTVSWNSTTDSVWTIDTANQKIYLDVSEVQATDLYGSGTGAKDVTFTGSTTTITLSRAVQDLKTPAIDFSNASILTEQDLDNSAKNVFHTAQQAVISTENAMLYSESTDAYSAAGPGSAVAKKIKNVATPTDSTDAATKGYVDGDSSVQTVAGLSTEIGLLGTSAMATATTGHIPVLAESTYKAKVETVAGTDYKAKVEAVAGKEDEVGRLGTAEAVADLAALGDTAFSHATTGHLKKVSDKATEITSVAAIDTEVGVVGESVYKGKVETVAGATYKGQIETVADSTYKGKIETVADSTYKGKVETVADSTYKAKVETVAGDTTAINSVHTNITNVNSFANTYFGAHANDTAVASHISTNSLTLGAGDLYYNTTSNSIESYNGSSWESMKTVVGGSTVTSAEGANLTLTTVDDHENVIINSTTGTSGNTIVLPKVRASTNNYVLAMDNISTGTTAWQVTSTAPTINSISGALNHDQDSTLTLFGADFSATTTVSLWNADAGGSKVGSDATITNQTTTKLEATFGHGDLNVGATLYVEASNSGITARFATAFTVSADPTVTFTQGTGSGANTTNHLGTYGGRVAGGGQDSNTKLLLNFDRGGGTDIEDSSNTGGDGHKVTANDVVIKASPFGDGKSAMYFDGGDYLEIADSPVIGAGNYTIDFWINPSSTQNGTPAGDWFWVVEGRGSISEDTGLVVQMHETNFQIRLYNGNSGAIPMDPSSDTALSSNTWQHVAIVRSGTGSDEAKFYINGHLKATFTDSTTWSAAGSDFIGANYNGDHPFTGYIDEVRIVVGEAVFTSDFTPSQYRYGTTGATHEVSTASNMKVLIHSDQSDYLYYERNPTRTNIGQATSQDTTKKAGSWSDGSLDLTNTSSRLYFNNLPTSFYTSNSNKFTIEGWFRPTVAVNTGVHGLWGTADKYLMMRINGTTGEALLSVGDGNNWDTSNAYDHQTGVIMSQNTWTHFATVYDGSKFMFFEDGDHQDGKDLTYSSITATTDFEIGAQPGGPNDFVGYIDEFRISDNARYTNSGYSNQTSAFSVDSNTVLLIHGNGGKFTDSSSSPHTITATGVEHQQSHGGIAPALTFPASLKATGSAGVYFGGVADYVLDFDGAVGPSVNGARSFEAFIHQTQSSSGDTQYIWSYGEDADGKHFGLSIDHGAYLKFQGYGSAYNFNTTATQASFLNTWKHVAVTHDGTTVRVFVDGTQVGAESRTLNTTDGAGSGDNLHLGYSILSASTDYFNGYIDCFRVSDIVRHVNNSGTYTYPVPTQIYGTYKDKTIPTITFTGQLASGSLASDEDIEFSNVANTSITSGMQKLDDSKIGLTLTNLTGSDKNKATLTGTVSDDFSGTTRANLPVKAQVRTERGNAAYDSTGSSKRLVTFSSSTNTEGLQPGYTVTGTGIPAGTTITSIDSATTLTLSADTTGGNLSSQTLHFGDPERQIHVNGSEVLDNTDSMLTIAVDSETKPVLFSARRYKGNDLARSITGFGWNPDLVWFKSRDTSLYHRVHDSIRGGNKAIYSNHVSGENTMSGNDGYITSFDSDGVSISTDTSNNGLNNSPDGIIAWGWQAGGEPSGTLGTINSGNPSGAGTIADTGNATNITQSVNQNSGFSITKFTGNDSGCTIPHNLGGTPEFFMIKNLDQSQSWACWHKDLSGDTEYRISLDLNDAELQESPSGSGKYFPTAPNSTTITCGSDDGQGGSTDDFICYAWKAVANVSKFGTYSGGTTDKTLDLDFFPRFFMTKRINGTAHWMIWDTFRSGASSSGDSMLPYIVPNNTEGDQSANDGLNLYESGSIKGVQFKSTDNYSNQSGGTYVYCAFA